MLYALLFVPKFSVYSRDSRVDFPYGLVIVDPKVVDEFHQDHFAQMLGYLAITGLELAMLINFKHASLRWKRIVKSGAESDDDSPCEFTGVEKNPRQSVKSAVDIPLYQKQREAGT